MDDIKTIINWISVKDKIPTTYGWYMTICVPRNYEEFNKNPSEMNDWIAQFGIDKTWFNNGNFFDRDKKAYPREITDRIIYWAEIPNVPQL